MRRPDSSAARPGRGAPPGVRAGGADRGLGLMGPGRGSWHRHGPRRPARGPAPPAVGLGLPAVGRGPSRSRSARSRAGALRRQDFFDQFLQTRIVGGGQVDAHAPEPLAPHQGLERDGVLRHGGFGLGLIDEYMEIRLPRRDRGEDLAVNAERRHVMVWLLAGPRQGERERTSTLILAHVPRLTAGFGDLLTGSRRTDRSPSDGPGPQPGPGPSSPGPFGCVPCWTILALFPCYSITCSIYCSVRLSI